MSVSKRFYMGWFTYSCKSALRQLPHCTHMHKHTHAKCSHMTGLGPGGVVGLVSSAEQGLERKKSSLFFNHSPLRLLDQESQERMGGHTKTRYTFEMWICYRRSFLKLVDVEALKGINPSYSTDC